MSKTVMKTTTVSTKTVVKLSEDDVKEILAAWASATHGMANATVDFAIPYSAFIREAVISSVEVRVEEH